MTRKIEIFDTTLRDGEQSPGASMNTDEKLTLTKELLRLNVDVIEAGFPISSPGDLESVRQIADLVGDRAVVAALSRAVRADIECAAEALRDCPRPRIHTGLGVSESHMRDKLGMTPEQVIERAVFATRLARSYTDDVEFYCEDAGRSDYVFLARVCEAVIAAGATVVNIPDTTGYSLPDEFGARIRYLMEHVRGIEDVTVSVHCHNDLGLATALTLEGVRNGATQVECTVNGLGERAGNTAMEEVCMAIRMHGDEIDAHTTVNAREFTRASHMVSTITGILVQPNKAIVGANAFSHSSGIHQDGVIKDRTTYEIIDPEEVGAGGSRIILSARSGHHALRHRLDELDIRIDESRFDELYQSFLELADKKKEIYDEDLEALVNELDRTFEAFYTLKSLQISCGFPLIPTATLQLVDRDGNVFQSCTTGHGPIDATYKAIDQITKLSNDLKMFSIQSVSRGIDALGEVSVRIQSDDGRIFTGRGTDADIIVSSAKAYLNALNRMVTMVEKPSLAEEASADE